MNMNKNYHYNQNNDYNNNINNKPIIDYRSIISPLLANAVKGNTNIVLLTTGAFNPIHRMHLEILNMAYEHLLSYKNYNVLCAFISPSADCYVRHKKPPSIPFELRCDMIQTSIEGFYEENKAEGKEQLKIYINKWEGSHSYFIDFPEVIHEIQNELRKIGDIKLLYVCGMDHYIKCYYALQKNVIVIDRKPYQVQENDPRFQTNTKKLIFIIRDEKSKPYSSTFIRESYQKGDLDTIRQYTFPTVDEMIIKFYDEYYGKNTNPNQNPNHNQNPNPNQNPNQNPNPNPNQNPQFDKKFQ